jgi:hypothetical protein
VASEELPPAEAVAAYDLSEATLRRRLAAGTIAARKVHGVRGREWRIAASELEQAGYSRRPTTAPSDTDAVLKSEAHRLQEALAYERARAAALDSQLGYALLTVGRLRAAGIDPDELFGADLATARDAQPPVVRQDSVASGT